MRHLGSESNKTNCDLWMKVCTGETANGPFICVDICRYSILCIHNGPDSLLTKLDMYFPLKPDSVGKPDIFLGAKLKVIQLENCVQAWGYNPPKYVQEAISDCKLYVDENLPFAFALFIDTLHYILSRLERMCHLNYHPSMLHTTNLFLAY